MNRAFTLVIVGIVALATSLVPAFAWAGAEDQAAAEALFLKAKNLMEQGKFAEACPMLVESNQVDPAVGTLLYLGECYEQIGQTASAWATFQAAADAARKAAQPEREKMARDRAIALIGRLSKLAVSVGAAARVPGLEVRRDGVELREASWGIGVPVDPGEHTVTAKAPGKQDWSQKIRVEAGGGTTTAEIARLDDAAPPPQPAPPPVAPAPALRAPVPAPPVAREPPSNPGSAQRAVAYVLGGVGVVGLAVGTIFGIQAKLKERDANRHCLATDPTRCTAVGVDLMDQGKAAARVANVGFIAGGIALAGGVVLYLTAPSRRPDAAGATQRARLRLASSIGRERAWVTLGGSF